MCECVFVCAHMCAHVLQSLSRASRQPGKAGKDSLVWGEGILCDGPGKEVRFGGSGVVGPERYRPWQLLENACCQHDQKWARHTAHIPDTRVKLGRVLAPITANHLLTERESSSQLSMKRNPAVPESSRGVFSVSFGRKHLWMLSYHRWYLCINTHFEGAVVGKIKARFQQLPLSFGPPHHQAWDNCLLSLELWSFTLKGFSLHLLSMW